MPNHAGESGKSRLMKGSLLYLWEEIKTMNGPKFRALSRIISGYFKMKFQDGKARKKTYREPPENQTWL